MQSAQNALFGVGVHAGQRVVEDENGRAAQQGAGNGGALLLPSGERDAALAHHGFKPLRKLLEFLADMGGFGGLEQVLRPALGAPKARFSRIVSLKRKVSCGTMPMLRRRTARG